MSTSQQSLVSSILEMFQAALVKSSLLEVYGASTALAPLRGSYIRIQYRSQSHPGVSIAQGTIALVLQTIQPMITYAVTSNEDGQTCLCDLKDGDFAIVPATDVSDLRKSQLRMLHEIYFRSFYKSVLLHKSVFTASPDIDYACGALVSPIAAQTNSSPMGTIGMVMLRHADGSLGVVWFDDTFWYGKTISTQLVPANAATLSEAQRNTFARMYGYVTSKFASACFTMKTNTLFDQMIKPFPKLMEPTATLGTRERSSTENEPTAKRSRRFNNKNI